METSDSPLYKVPLSPITLYPVLTMEALLLSDSKRRSFVKKINRYAGLDVPHYQTFYEPTLIRFVECVQLFPYQFGGKPGSLMDYSLERATAALRHYHQSAGADFSSLYAYALFTSALFQDIGKVISQQACMISDVEGKFIQTWLPFEGSLLALNAQYYKLRPIGSQWITLGQSVTPILARQCMPSAGFEWIAQDYKIFAMWMGILYGESESEGELLHWLHLDHNSIGSIPKKDRLGGLDIKVTKPAQTAIGEEFIDWLRKGLADESIPVNTLDAQVHILSENELLLESGIFKLFAKGRGGIGWMVACKQFNMLGLAKLSGEDFEFERFFSKTQEALSIENAARNPSGMFFNLGAGGTPPSASLSGEVEGVVVNKPELLYTHKSMPPVSNFIVSNKSSSQNILPVLKGKPQNWAGLYGTCTK